jgi:predicted metalloprotease
VKRSLTSVIALVLVPVLMASCAQPADETLLTGGSPGGGPTAPVSSDDPAAVADRAVDDVSAFWRETYPDLYGGEFEEVAGFYPYGPDTEPPPCGSPPPEYEMIADNAFYCPGDDIIAWDEYQLLPALNDEFGAFTVAIVIAHEFGHAIQARFGTGDRTVDLELQADCFAGSWTARVAAGHAQGFEPGDVDLDKTVAGMIAIRDLPGTSADDLYAHGSGFDRVSAFQDGYENGAEKCAEYADESEDRRTAEIEFQDQADYDRGGNFPLEDADAPDGQGLLTLLEQDLNTYYDRLFTELGEQFAAVDDLVLVDPASDSVACGGDTLAGDELDYAAVYCEDENVVVLDGDGLVASLNDEIGDFAVASEVARLWALAAQSQLGSGDGDDADLQADCLTGAWAAWTFPATGDGSAPSEVLEMSAGDLDEGIMGFVAYGTATGADGRTVFERTEALRTGFFEAYDACEEYGPLG